MSDGRFVAFESYASNLVPNSEFHHPNVFVHDRRTGTTELVSAAADGSTAGGKQVSISADGRYVAFTSGASNLVPGDTNSGEDPFTGADEEPALVGAATVGPEATSAEAANGHVTDEVDETGGVASRMNVQVPIGPPVVAQIAGFTVTPADIIDGGDVQ